MDSYMASNGSCFMVTWIIFKNHLLEVGLTQKQGDHDTLNTHNCCWFVLFYHAWELAWIKFIEIAFRWGDAHIWLHTTPKGPWPHYMILGVVLGRPLDTFYWALRNSWSRVLACVWGGPKVPPNLTKEFPNFLRDGQSIKQCLRASTTF
jgi:hypothetical protein